MGHRIQRWRGQPNPRAPDDQGGWQVAQCARRSDAIARSTYAAYNGGPDEFDRWRRADEPHDKRLIDEAFWQKYRALKEGQSLNILKCEAEWGHEPGH